MTTTTGLIDNQALAMMRREFARTFDTTVSWYKQKYDTNGVPLSDLYGNKNWEPPVTLPARVTTELEEQYHSNQIIQQRFARVSLPPNTGVRAGDVILLEGQSFERRVPIIGVAQIPSEDRAVLEFVTMGIGV